MKILFIGVYRDGTGWAQSAIDYILAMDAAGIPVVPRPLRLNNHKAQLPARLLELEKRSSSGCDIVIQHTLPHHMDYSGHFGSNIGLFFSETTNFKRTTWPQRINLLDKAWVPNNFGVNAARNSGVTIPVQVVPCATDITRFQAKYEKMDFAQQLSGEFFFYTIGEITRRKNLAALLRAFHSEFSPMEPVQLVIKASQPGLEAGECSKQLQKYCNEIKTGLKLGELKQEIIITNRLSAHGIMRLHASCDCFVSASYGEAWCIPAFDAMACGKTPIVTNWGGFTEYMSDNAGWLVDCREEPVFGMDKESFNDLYTAEENWGSISITDLRRCMREAYENRGLRETKAEFGINRAYDFGYDVVGQHIKKVLEHGQKKQSVAPTDVRGPTC
jgi:glycosyltransferase involved in cell wall biosynthesis